MARRKGVFVGGYIPEKLRDKVDELASTNEVSLTRTQMIEVLLKEAIEARERAKK